MNDDVKYALIEMFGEDKFDPEYVKPIKTKALQIEYANVMEKLRDEAKIRKEQEKQKILESLNNDDLNRIVDLYMQDILAIYEKKNHSKVDIIVR